MRRVVRMLAFASVAAATTLIPSAAAQADDVAPAATGTAGPYNTWTHCEYWRDYYAVFYNTTSCYRGEIAFWYFDYCCI